MRAIRTTTISILALGLLVGSAVGVAAQEDGQAYVEGSFVSFEDCVEAEEWTECPIRLVATDSRLAGEGILRYSDLQMGGLDSYIVLSAQSLRVANDDGAWVGNGLLYWTWGDYGFVGENEPTWLLTGDGLYTGLTAVLRADVPNTFAGVIVEAEPPAAPPLPPAE